MTANITQQVVPRRTQHVSFRTRWQRGSVTPSTITVAFAVVVSVALGLLSFAYLQQVFSTANQGADVAELKTRLIEISEQQRELELEGAKLRSIDTVEERVQQLNLVESTNHAFLAPDVHRVAFDG